MRTAGGLVGADSWADLARRALVCGLAALVCLLSAVIAHAAVLSSQQPLDGADGFASISAEQAGDDFSLSSNATVSRITWWGSYAADAATLPADSFRVRFFHGNGSGEPSISPFAEYTNQPSRALTALADATGVPVYQFELTLPVDLALTGGKTVFLSVINEFDVGDPIATWFWLLSDDQGSNFFRFADDDAWQGDATGNFAFELADAPTAIPVPATLLLLMSGMAALVGIGARLRREGC